MITATLTIGALIVLGGLLIGFLLGYRLHGRWEYAEREHLCSLPDLYEGRVGDVWRCYKCKQRWLMSRGNHGARGWERYDPVTALEDELGIGEDR